MSDRETLKGGAYGRMRFVVRCGVAVAVVLLCLPVLPWGWSVLVVPAASPFVMICSAVGRRSLGVIMWVGVPLLLIALLRRRWLCRWACPVGLLLELTGKLRRAAQRSWKRVPPIGQWIALLTLGGALLGYPFLLWLDPLSLFSGFFSLVRQPLQAAAVASAIGLPILVVTAFVWPSLWCARLCPLGGTQELLVAPKQMLQRMRASRNDDQESPARGTPLARRAVLAIGAGAACGAGRWALGARDEAVLRPPGAVDAARFAGLCARCGSCVRVCPERIIHPDLGKTGVAGFLTPVVRFEETYCHEDCNRCTQCCPTGAIAQLSLPQKRAAVMGLARVDMAMCLLAEERECAVCENQCPYDAVKIVFDEKEYRSTPRIDPEKCNGCGACQVACPSTPKAIVVVPSSS